MNCSLVELFHVNILNATGTKVEVSLVYDIIVSYFDLFLSAEFIDRPHASYQMV